MSDTTTLERSFEVLDEESSPGDPTTAQITITVFGEDGETDLEYSVFGDTLEALADAADQIDNLGAQVSFRKMIEAGEDPFAAIATALGLDPEEVAAEIEAARDEQDS